MNPAPPEQQQQVILIKTPEGGYIVANQSNLNELSNSNQAFVDRAAHPNICLLHMFFKVVAAALYFLSGIISTSTLTAGLSIIVVGAFDFWVVKNITGRYLVGLRWWTEHLVDGKEKWMFECRPDESMISKGDSRMFWSGQIIYVLGGIGLVVLSFIISSWSLLIPILFCVGEGGFNLYAFYKCSREQQAKVKNLVDETKNKAGNFVAKNLFKSIKLPMGIDIKV